MLPYRYYFDNGIIATTTILKRMPLCNAMTVVGLRIKYIIHKDKTTTQNFYNKHTLNSFLCVQQQP